MLQMAFGYITEWVVRIRDGCGEKRREVRGGLGSQTAQGFFPQQGPSSRVLRDPWHFRSPSPPQKRVGSWNKHMLQSKLSPCDTHRPPQPLLPQNYVYISGTRLCESCRWRSTEHERVCVCVCACVLSACVRKPARAGRKLIILFMDFERCHYNHSLLLFSKIL